MTFKIACGANEIHKEAAMWVVLHYVEGTLASALNSLISAEDHLLSFAYMPRLYKTKVQGLANYYTFIQRY